MSVKSSGGGAALWFVGSIFISTLATNPAALLGFGTWTAFGQGRVLVGLDAGDPDFDTAESVLGEKAHVLTTPEMPSHVHTYTAPNAPAANRLLGVLSSVDGVTAGAATGSAGSGAAHNNLQPSIVVYMWKRTA